MYRPRIIPTLLLKGNGLVKSIKFKQYNYIGDPINAVKLFNDLKADELVFLDINATIENRIISKELVKKIGEEANMPFAVGGGIRQLKDIEELLKVGVERIIINSYAAENPEFIKSAVNDFGSSSIIVCIDVKNQIFKGEKVYIKNGKKSTNYKPVEFAQLMQSFGVGELIIQSIDKDGTMNGYDFELISKIANVLTIPIIALGGAGNINDMKNMYQHQNINGLAGGSIFVYKDDMRGVLINYPNKSEIKCIFN